jgi:AraC-like DNA-binding protein
MLEFHCLRMGERLDLARVDAAWPGDRLHLAVASHRGAQLNLPPAWQSVWIGLRGNIQLHSPCGAWPLRQDLLVAQEGPLQASIERTSAVLVVAGSAIAWRHALATCVPERACSALLVEQRPCPRLLRRQMVHLARVARTKRDRAGDAFAPLLRSLLDGQHDMRALADRCSGRTPHRRLLTLQRLLRVRQLIERRGDGHLDLARLAGSANYSPWHLIRLYRELFGETPSEHVARVRLARAWSLVHDSTLPVCEITLRLGFESQSAFCRAFKSAYGLTTTQARHLAAGGSAVSPRPAHARPRTRPAPGPLTARR